MFFSLAMFFGNSIFKISASIFSILMIWCRRQGLLGTILMEINNHVKLTKQWEYFRYRVFNSLFDMVLTFEFGHDIKILKIAIFKSPWSWNWTSIKQSGLLVCEWVSERLSRWIPGQLLNKYWPNIIITYIIVYYMFHCYDRTAGQGCVTCFNGKTTPFMWKSRYVSEETVFSGSPKISLCEKRRLKDT